MHHIEKCMKCDKIISQCRFMYCNKTVTWAICEECRVKEDSMRPEIEEVVKRWDKFFINPHPNSPCNVPFGFLRNVERYILRLEKELTKKEEE